MNNKKIQEQFIQHHRMLKIRDFVTNFAALSLFDKPELDFKDDFMTMGNEGSCKSLKYWYSDPSVVTTVTKEITMPSTEITFAFSNEQLSNITKAAAVIGAPDMVFEDGSLKVTDKKNDTANHFSMDVELLGAEVQQPDYKFWFKVENLKLMPGTYDVSISSKRISHFKNTNVDIEYYIALEPESYYK